MSDFVGARPAPPPLSVRVSTSPSCTSVEWCVRGGFWTFGLVRLTSLLFYAEADLRCLCRRIFLIEAEIGSPRTRVFLRNAENDVPITNKPLASFPQHEQVRVLVSFVVNGVGRAKNNLLTVQENLVFLRESCISADIFLLASV